MADKLKFHDAFLPYDSFPEILSEISKSGGFNSLLHLILSNNRNLPRKGHVERLEGGS